MTATAPPGATTVARPPGGEPASAGSGAPPAAPFDNRFTRQFGVPSVRVQTKVRDCLTAEVQAFIRRSPFLVMATADAGGRCDASPKGGTPGFVAILDDRHLLVPDVAGNRLFQSYLNMAANPHVGLLFLIPGSNRTVRVNGRVMIVDKDEVLTRNGAFGLHNPDEHAVTLQGFVVEVEEAYTHCPRSFKFADLWNVETIAAFDEP